MPADYRVGVFCNYSTIKPFPAFGDTKVAHPRHDKGDVEWVSMYRFYDFFLIV